jgi:type I restriction enzyme S subunit
MAISADDFINMPVPVSNPPEQQKIADCLSSIDALIAAEAEKLEALKDHKKGLMQQLFPAPGETTPRLRLPEFQDAGDWREDQIGRLCNLYQAVTLSTSDLNQSGDYLVYGANGVIGMHDEYNHEESEVIVTCRGATCGEVTRTEAKSWINGNAMVVNPRACEISKDYIYHFLKSDGLKSVISGSAQPQITRIGLSPLLLKYPGAAEQQRIADCLSSIDTLVAAQGSKIDGLKAHKNGLMQQLFPVADEVQA